MSFLAYGCRFIFEIFTDSQPIFCVIVFTGWWHWYAVFDCRYFIRYFSPAGFLFAVFSFCYFRPFRLSLRFLCFLSCAYATGAPRQACRLSPVFGIFAPVSSPAMRPRGFSLSQLSFQIFFADYRIDWFLRHCRMKYFTDTHQHTMWASSACTYLSLYGISSLPRNMSLQSCWYTKAGFSDISPQELQYEE